jgi:protein-tyrosine kinase
MTRLSDALERAQMATAPEAVVTPAEVAPDREAGDDIPRAWRLDSDEEAETPEAPRKVLALDKPSAVQATEYRFGDSALKKVVVGPHAETAVVEQYRRLAAILHHAQRDHGARSVMVTSAVEAEGKTLTATNLALTLSQSYERRVLLIDADLRRPSIHKMFQLENRVGLSNSLKQPDSDHRPVQHVLPRLWILPAGRPDPDPMGGLVSGTMKQLLIDATAQFDWVVVDTPPVALLPDANLLANMIDTALLVVSANTTPYPLVQRSIDAIGASRILGVVFNRADPSMLSDGYGYYGYGYSHREEKPQDGRRRFGFGLFGRKQT